MHYFDLYSNLEFERLRADLKAKEEYAARGLEYVSQNPQINPYSRNPFISYEQEVKPNKILLLCH